MTLIEEEGKRENLEQEGMASTETDNLEMIPSASQSVLTQDALA